MKRIIAWILTFATLCSLLPFTFAAEQAEPSEEISAISPDSGAVYTQATSGTCGENLTWSFDESTGTLTISGTGYMDDYYYYPDDYSHPWIGFKDKILRLVVNDGVLDIEYYSFKDCTALSEVFFNGSSPIIRAGAFRNCENLKTVRVTSLEDWMDISIWYDINDEGFDELFPPNDHTAHPLYYGADLYINDEKLTHLVIPDGITRIWSNEFYNCTSITSVIIPASVTDIGSQAFNCPNLTDVVILNPQCYLTFSNISGKVFHAEKGSTTERYTENRDLVSFHACIYVDNGYGTHDFYCTVCNTAKVTNLPHTFKDGVCSCGYEGTCQEVGHNYQKDVVQLVTCTQDGENLFTCTRCADSYSEIIPATGHLGIERIAPVKNTCTTDGNILYYSCPTCGKYFSDEAYTVEIALEDTVLAASGHNYKAVITAPTCTAQGYTTYTCSVCSDSYVADYTDIIPHQNIVTEYIVPTCTESGFISSVCSGCGKKEEMIFPATGHSYEAVVTAPTCAEQGYTTYTCSACGDSYTTDETEVIPHSYEAVVTAPTCTEQGYTTYTCSVCADSYVADEVAATGHSYEAVITEPTCTEDGYTTYTCSVCADSYVADEVTASGHSYEAVITEPTCTEQGYTTYTCSVCADSYIADEVTASGHDFVDGFCTACGEEDPDYLPVNPFIDVKEDDYFHTPVLWAVKKEITNGTSESTFSPNESCTRAQIVTFLWRAYGCMEPTATENPFTDVDSDAYYYKAVLWAVENGITTGMSATEFAPDATCTRGQAVTFLYRAAGTPTVTASENPFTDVTETDYFYHAVLWAAENGITNGVSATEFAPDDHCSRAQIVTFLYRALA